jgi:hypothetical protein
MCASENQNEKRVMYTSLQYWCLTAGTCLRGTEGKLCATLVCIQNGFAPVWRFAPRWCIVFGALRHIKSQRGGWLFDKVN